MNEAEVRKLRNDKIARVWKGEISADQCVEELMDTGIRFSPEWIRAIISCQPESLKFFAD